MRAEFLLIVLSILVFWAETAPIQKRQDDADWWNSDSSSENSRDYEEFLAWKRRRNNYLRRKQYNYNSSRWRDYHYHYHEPSQNYNYHNSPGYSSGYGSGYGSGYYPGYGGGYGGGYGSGGGIFSLGFTRGLGISTPIGGFGIGSGFGIGIG
ncbi:unnamed protein product [Caenorhabditis angaria]|uniref:Uncharacterized protein n=1 Tax=Caenorhabditis angaria TaxID=860376 RepID=A0A9P1IEU9_9PELO|nr:unnamed protein product [Caenorhabditis angaria]